MSHSDSNFYKPFIFVLGALVLFTFFIVAVARMLSPASPDDPLAVAEMQRSIAPVGQVRVVEPVEPVAAPTDTEAADTEEAAPAAEEAETTDAAEATEVATDAAKDPVAEETETAASTDATAGAAATTAMVASAGSADVSMKVKAAVATNCAGCHAAGLNGAQKSDDAAAWSALSDEGIDALAASVINGKGAMPARAESSLSDDEIKQAVQLMIANATGESMASAAATTSASGADSTEAPVTDAPAVSEAATAAAATAVAAAPSAEVPAAVKQVVDSTCAACHIAGVANAPKFGDQEAWAPRIEKGLDALVASSIAGIGVMPPRGGSQLDDEQMRLAVEYMLTK